ncbi:class I SAM-dependent methyltransferase [Nocardioides dubius]|uniref:Class I SAM-dependent methyltransferase n=2 Tax=Nocardioides dubius TaxID=317019 RepID=A0ABN1TRX8_9ACTN
MPRPTTLAAALAASAPIPGWLTAAQGTVLFDAARSAVPGGAVVEIGSHHGRSMVVLAAAAPVGCRVVAIDPFGPDWRYGEAGTEAALRANLARHDLAERVDVRVSSSEQALPGWTEPISLLYIDGAHDLRSVRHDLGWRRHVLPGAQVLIHDAFSSVGVTVGLLPELLGPSRLRYLRREGSLAVFEHARPRLRDRLRMACQLGWWLRNVVIKVLLRLRLSRVAGLLGHHDTADPY